MNKKSQLLSLLLITATSVAALSTQTSEAQSYRYMDDSGNIYFVERLAEVPPKYRSQVVPPTPTIDPRIPTPRPTRRPTATPRPKNQKGKDQRERSKDLSEKERLKIYLEYKKSLEQKAASQLPPATPTRSVPKISTPLVGAREMLNELDGESSNDSKLK